MIIKVSTYTKQAIFTQTTRKCENTVSISIKYERNCIRQFNNFFVGKSGQINLRLTSLSIM